MQLESQECYRLKAILDARQRTASSVERLLEGTKAPFVLKCNLESAEIERLLDNYIDVTETLHELQMEVQSAQSTYQSTCA